MSAHNLASSCDASDSKYGIIWAPAAGGARSQTQSLEKDSPTPQFLSSSQSCLVRQVFLHQVACSIEDCSPFSSIFTPLCLSIVFYLCNGRYEISYIDSLFNCVSAMTVCGLATIDLSQLTGFQQALLFIQMSIGNTVSCRHFLFSYTAGQQSSTYVDHCLLGHGRHSKVCIIRF
jgi:hypothetical protein